MLWRHVESVFLLITVRRVSSNAVAQISLTEFRKLMFMFAEVCTWGNAYDGSRCRSVDCLWSSAGCTAAPRLCGQIQLKPRVQASVDVVNPLLTTSQPSGAGEGKRDPFAAPAVAGSPAPSLSSPASVSGEPAVYVPLTANGQPKQAWLPTTVLPQHVHLSRMDRLRRARIIIGEWLIAPIMTLFFDLVVLANVLCVIVQVRHRGRCRMCCVWGKGTPPTRSLAVSF